MNLRDGSAVRLTVARYLRQLVDQFKNHTIKVMMKLIFKSQNRAMSGELYEKIVLRLRIV
jgi:hypothetical protein